MSKSPTRPGGRSARVQESVHRAVQALMNSMGRDALTVPSVAVQAGVTPSTIYRRWGDLPTLLADVALERMRPETGPLDSGDLQTDLEAWAEQYHDEMSSAPGRAMMRDVLSGSDDRQPCRCGAITRAQLQIIIDRAIARGEAAPSADLLIDYVVAPIVFRLLYDDTPATAAYPRVLVRNALSGSLV